MVGEEVTAQYFAYKCKQRQYTGPFRAHFALIACVGLMPELTKHGGSECGRVMDESL